MEKNHPNILFNKDMQEIVACLLKMGGFAQSQFHLATNILTNNLQGKKSKIATIEQSINKSELSIDKLCTEFFIKHHPAATDLRMILAIMRSANDLERIGDEAFRIAEIARDTDYSDDHIQLLQALIDQIDAMFTTILAAYENLDSTTARTIFDDEKKVDIKYREIVVLLSKDSQHECAINMLWTARAMERIADHIQNLAEQLVYGVEGTDLRHQ